MRGSDPGLGESAMLLRLTMAHRVLRRVGQLGAGSEHLRTKDRQAFLPGSQPPGATGTLWGSCHLDRRMCVKAGQVSLGGHTERSRNRRPGAGEGQGCGREKLGPRPGGPARPTEASDTERPGSGFFFHQEECASLDSQAHEHPPSTRGHAGSEGGSGVEFDSAALLMEATRVYAAAREESQGRSD